MPHLVQSATPFLGYLEDWHGNLPELALDELVGGKPENIAVMCVDVVVGF